MSQIEKLDMLVRKTFFTVPFHQVVHAQRKNNQRSLSYEEVLSRRADTTEVVPLLTQFDRQPVPRFLSDPSLWTQPYNGLLPLILPSLWFKCALLGDKTISSSIVCHCMYFIVSLYICISIM